MAIKTYEIYRMRDPGVVRMEVTDERLPLKNNNFMYLWLCLVFAAAWGLAVVTLLHCEGFSLQWILLLWNMGFRACRLHQLKGMSF